MILNVITSCIRLRNLPRILESIKISNTPKIEIRWYIVLDNNNLKLPPEQIEKIRESLPNSPEISINLRIFQDSYTVSWPTNLALDEIQDGLVCVIDDDNIMHPDYLNTIYQIAKDKPEIGILYAQMMDRNPPTHNARIRKIVPYLVAPSYVDTAQITVSRSLIGTCRWAPVSPDNIMYSVLIRKDQNPQGQPFQPDGKFIAQVYEKHFKHFVILDQPLCYYNYLSQ